MCLSAVSEVEPYASKRRTYGSWGGARREAGPYPAEAYLARVRSVDGSCSPKGGPMPRWLVIDEIHVVLSVSQFDTGCSCDAKSRFCGRPQNLDTKEINLCDHLT